VIETFFETQRLLFNDLDATHGFFVAKPSAHLEHVRYVDLTINIKSGEYDALILRRPCSRLLGVQRALANATHLHDLRVSFNIWDPSKWRHADEAAVVELLRDVRVKGKVAVELPAWPASWRLCAGHREPWDDATFDVRRRPARRYFGNSPESVELVNLSMMQEAAKEEKLGCCVCGGPVPEQEDEKGDQETLAESRADE
jgi:hypothetical protein